MPRMWGPTLRAGNAVSDLGQPDRYAAGMDDRRSAGPAPADVRGIRRLIDTYAADRPLLSKATVALYEDVQEFWVAEAERRRWSAAARCTCMWEDLAEVRTVAVDPDWRGRKIGHRLVAALLDAARDVGVRRVFVLTFETDFFGSFGFVRIDGTPVRPTCTSSCCAPTTRAWPSSSTWNGSSRTRSATPACCCTSDRRPGRPGR